LEKTISRALTVSTENSECVLVNEGFERERMIELWKIATLPAENSAHAVVTFFSNS
jgi:hypothetical protein